MTSTEEFGSIAPRDESFIPPALHLMQPWEKVSAEQLESVRIQDALQSLSSPLYAAKAERLGMEEYLKRYSTSRVR